MFYSPLRYPGGKQKLAKFISQVCELNNISGHYIEPYAGGASVALFLLLEERVSKITINDADRSIYAFWHSALYETKKFCNLIEITEVNIENWHKAKAVQQKKDRAPLLALGFSTFFLNRTNISGTLNAGVIGSYKQTGKYKIDCRFNKTTLIERIKRISARKNDIVLHNLDAIELIKKLQKESSESNSIYYFDPPYYLKGKSLYMNHYEHEDHREISDLIQSIKNVNWIVSYDNVPQIRKLYKNIQKRKVYSLGYSAHGIRKGKEILFFNNQILVPKIKDPIKV
ncbi:DNA methyltransferase [Candidatus Peregrinibacteria bacterium CG10_big_fil_rev_8_21_14_0_10_55_24]|nr:MAG: DNA methyltransferase [Candidatus Peregrinibacteria bacterium CG10_big_fil_rev_8_21_14_0_10_55_24]